MPEIKVTQRLHDNNHAPIGGPIMPVMSSGMNTMKTLFVLASRPEIRIDTVQLLGDLLG